ncbi:MAG: nitrogenase iron-molybdenum cofactor biosynthesis protein NifE [Nitrospirae bacterium]|nr:nitrogenase iron-molybdenum cofactor biosynthesis protein NifE [Nitrospirota bacterium]
MLSTPDRLFEHSCSPTSADGVCRSRGGESCAFDGAMIVLQCIADAAHLVHGPIACSGNSWESRGTVSDKGVLHKRAYTTDLGELDIVYGAEEKLVDAICATAKDSGASAVFVYSTCVTGLTGEDMDAACREAEASLGIRVIPVHAPGFVGPKNLGNRIAGDVLLDHVIGTGVPAVVTDTDVNLIGEYNIAGDLALVQPVLERAGLNVMSRLTGNATIWEAACAHRARLNAVVCGRALINVAREMENRYGIPYVEVSFFGKTEMSHALRTIARNLPDSDAGIVKNVELVIAEEEASLAERLTPYASLRGRKAVLYTGGVKSWSFISALMDLGIEVVAVGAKKATAEDEEKMKRLMGPDAPIYEDMTPKRILGLMREHEADILIAGGRNQYLAIKEGFPFVDVNQERHTAYAGYDGLVNLARNIKSAIDFYAGHDTAGLVKRATKPVVQRGPVSVNPLKHSASIGAAMALQGVDGAAVVLHGAQGCNFLGKVLLTKHFREPIAMVSTKLFSEDVVMGSEERLENVLRDTVGKNAPALVGILTTGLVEVKGENVEMAVKTVEATPPAPLPPSPPSGEGEEKEAWSGASMGAGAVLLHIPTPDYKGGLEEGYAAAVEKLAGLATPGIRVASRVNVLAGAGLTPADVNELRYIIEDFGLEPVILPDLSALDGSRVGFSPLASGGVTVNGIRSMGTSTLTLVIGPSLEKAGMVIRDNCGVPYVLLDGLSGIAATDKLMDILAGLSGRGIPVRYRRERAVLVDGMRDAMARVSGARIAVAQETDAAAGLSALIAETGARVGLAVIPTDGPGSGSISADEVMVGDYGSIRGEFDLLISGSHGRQTADAFGIPLLEYGFPVFERLGHGASPGIGYRGSLEMVNRMGNTMMEAHV